MSVSHSVYVGPYIKIIKEDFNHVRNVKGCVKPRCNQYRKEISGKFCSDCGNPIEEFEKIDKVKFNIHNFCNKHFNDEDLFSTASEYGPTIIISNQSGQGGRHLDDDTLIDITDISKNVPEIWNQLSVKLTENGIEHIQGIGVVGWWS